MKHHIKSNFFNQNETCRKRFPTIVFKIIYNLDFIFKKSYYIHDFYNVMNVQDNLIDYWQNGTIF